ncbi:MAG: hypothetical protein A2Y80_03060 [Deltaproteobacteria bacterium RBG_13_58_19]|nr:MAG: hypothetical protein A2Y80_03060 [Deltaproteobacteria bacterium RBG_13_58_19]
MSSMVFFQDYSFWQDHKWDILPILALLLILGLLILTLLIILRKSRRMGMLLAARLGFETMRAELSARFINLPVQEIDQEIKQGLKPVSWNGSLPAGAAMTEEDTCYNWKLIKSLKIEPICTISSLIVGSC